MHHDLPAIALLYSLVQGVYQGERDGAYYLLAWPLRWMALFLNSK